MENISNTRIEKQKKEIEKTKAKISEFNAKLREQEKTLRNLEDLEIVARYRNVRGNEDFAAELRENQKEAALANDGDTVEKEE